MIEAEQFLHTEMEGVARVELVRYSNHIRNPLIVQVDISARCEATADCTSVD